MAGKPAPVLSVSGMIPSIHDAESALLWLQSLIEQPPERLSVKPIQLYITGTGVDGKRHGAWKKAGPDGLAFPDAKYAAGCIIEPDQVAMSTDLQIDDIPAGETAFIATVRDGAVTMAVHSKSGQPVLDKIAAAIGLA